MSENPLRSKALVDDIVAQMRDASAGLPPVKIMHVCGTHEHEIGRYALRKLFPKNVKLIAGPGCPVCITPASVIATAIKLATSKTKPILCTYGDIVRVPIVDGSLYKARSEGADIRIVYGPRDAIKIAKENPDREVIFFSVGFETTAAPVSSILQCALPDNFSIFCCHRYVPTAVEIVAGIEGNEISAYLLPGHASVITGAIAYEFLPKKFGKASAIAGFEPVDILSAVLSILRQIKLGEPTVANCYPRAVTAGGNVNAQKSIATVFKTTDAPWRGIGTLPRTGLELRDEYKNRDALVKFNMSEIAAEDILPGCSCHLIMMGKISPSECRLFGKACTPENPKGPCMVGAEGTCRANFLFPDSENEDV